MEKVMSTTTLRAKKKGTVMGKTLRARFKRGVFEPIEKIDLPEGKEVTLTVLDTPPVDEEAFWRAAGGWKGLIDADRLIRNIYADRLIRPRPKPRLR